MRREVIEKLLAEVARLVAEKEESAVNVAPSLLKACDVAARLQINTQAVYRLARDGRLPAVELGQRTKRWTEDVVSAFIKQRGAAMKDNRLRGDYLRVLQGNG
jgi:predicted DNA-binding transcriptional regulator AlpA